MPKTSVIENIVVVLHYTAKNGPQSKSESLWVQSIRIRGRKKSFDHKLKKRKSRYETRKVLIKFRALVNNCLRELLGDPNVDTNQLD